MPGTPRELEPKVPSIRIEDLRPDNSFDGSGLSNLRSRRSLRPQTCRPVGRLKLCPAVSGQPLRATQRAPSDQHLAAQEKHRGHWTTFLETATGGSAGNLCETAARVAGTDPLGASSVISRMGQGTQVVPPNCLGPCLPEGISPPPHPTQADKVRAPSEHVQGVRLCREPGTMSPQPGQDSKSPRSDQVSQ